MKRHALTLIIAVSLVLPAIAAAQQSTGLQCIGGTCTYLPLEPLPGGVGAQNGRDFPAFVAGLFRVLITFGGLFAVVMLTIAGIGYMLSESALDIEKAKDRAKAALWGLLLLMGSWLILNTINPNLLNFNLFNTDLNNSQLGNGSAGTGGSTQQQSAVPAAPDPAAKARCEASNGAYQATAGGSYTCVGLY